MQRSPLAIQVHRCTTGLRPRRFAVRRQRSPASTGLCSPSKEPVNNAAHPKSVASPAAVFFGRHVAPLPVVNQVARVQCASRSFAKVFVGQRIAPLPAPGKYRCPSSARGTRSSATLTVMASLSHLRSSKSCGAKYGAGSRAVALPNYYFKLINNGVPHWPSSAGPTAHFALAVQRAIPSSPAYFER